LNFLTGNLLLFSSLPAALASDSSPNPMPAIQQHWAELESQMSRCDDLLAALAIRKSRLLQGEFRVEFLKALRIDGGKDSLGEISRWIGFLRSDYPKEFVHRRIFRQLRRVDIAELAMIYKMEATNLSVTELVTIGELFQSFSQFESFTPLSKSYEELGTTVPRDNGVTSTKLYREQLLQYRDRLKSLEIDHWLINGRLLSLVVYKLENEILRRQDNEMQDLQEYSPDEEDPKFDRVHVRGLHPNIEEVSEMLFKNSYREARLRLQMLWSGQSSLAQAEGQYILLGPFEKHSLNRLSELTEDLEFNISLLTPQLTSESPESILLIIESMRLREASMQESLSQQCVEQFGDFLHRKNLPTIEGLIAGEFIFLTSLDPILDLLNAPEVDAELRSGVLELLRRYDWNHWR
jgi:hypothetical protein